MLRSWFWHKRHPFTFAAPPAARQRFTTIRGRRIAVDIPYIIPKDDEEIGRLDFQHYMLKLALRGNYAAPIKHPTTILDVATGSGRWAMEMAAQFPRAAVTGFDAIPSPADDIAGAYNPAARPANYVFRQGDMFERLPFPDNAFDFVHMRLVYAATPADRWHPLVNELARVTKTGGYVELVEGFIPINTGPAMAAIIAAITEASTRRGIDVTAGGRIGQYLRHTQLQHVNERVMHVPIGKRYGRLGAMCETDMLSVFRAIGVNVVDAGILGAAEWQRLFAATSGELDTATTVWPVLQVYGRK